MHSTMRLAVSIFLLASALTSAYHNGAKLRRDGVLNLYPFPRVGRASHHTWQIPLNEYHSEYEPEEKRQLYAFPRVGRSDLSLFPEPHADQFQPMPVRRADNPAMWFGPRLGRSYKSNDDDAVILHENNERSEPEQMESLQQERKKRQAKLN